MYWITLKNGGSRVYLHDPTDNLRQVMMASLTYTINEPDKLTFTVPYNHPAIADLTLGRCDVEVHKADPKVIVSNTNPYLYSKCRILRKSINWDRSVTVECEGLLGLLNDTFMPPTTFEQSGASCVANLFSQVIGQHNAAVNNASATYSSRTFSVHCTASTPSNYLGRHTDKYKSCMSFIKEQILDTQLGGYLYTHYNNVTPTSDIYYIQNMSTESTQGVVFAENLLDLNDELDGTNIFSGVMAVGKDGLVPLGTESLGTGFSWGTIETMSGTDKLVIYKNSLVSLYGKKISVQEWSDVTTRANLITHAKSLLNGVGIADSLKVSAFDLSTVDSNVEEWEIGKSIRVVSEPHGVDTTMALTEKTIDLLDPSATTISLGKQETRITNII